MYLGVDIGATKTLVAALDEQADIIEQVRFPTPEKYEQFLNELRQTLAGFKHNSFKAGGVGITGIIDREHGRRFASGKLAWQDIPIKTDAELITQCPIIVENDAKLAGLSEAMLLKDSFNKVLYLTVSTGIGFSLIVDGIIDTSIGDSGGNNIMIEDKGKRISWEALASGRAIVKRFGKRAEDIVDEASWKIIAHNVSMGLIEVVAITEPDVVVIGGGVGTHFDRFDRFLTAELKNYKLPSIHLPELRGAQRPEEAVIYGCYDLAKQVFSHG